MGQAADGRACADALSLIATGSAAATLYSTERGCTNGTTNARRRAGPRVGSRSRRHRGQCAKPRAASGTAVWAMSYVKLVPMGLYEPPWRYAPMELAMDLSYHLVYRVGVAAGYTGLARATG